MMELAMACNWTAALDHADDHAYGTPLPLFVTMSCLATLGLVYSAVFIVFNVVYRNDR